MLLSACSLVLMTYTSTTVATHDGTYSVISNGKLKLGVWPEGHLNVPGGSISSSGVLDIGLRETSTPGVEYESTAPGCLCEGWGAADAGTGLSIYFNQNYGSSAGTVMEITGPAGQYSTPYGTAVKCQVSLTDGDNKIRVYHDYHPLQHTQYLYEVTVTIENFGTTPWTDVRYRRVMDWDVEPTPFNERVTLYSSPGVSQLLTLTDNGFQTSNPLQANTPYSSPVTITGVAGGLDYRSGPTDHGACFDFGFGALAPGASKTFKTYYGAAHKEIDVLAALGSVGAETYSIGTPNLDDSDSQFNAFAFGFAVSRVNIAAAATQPPEACVDQPVVLPFSFTDAAETDPATGWTLEISIDGIGIISTQTLTTRAQIAAASTVYTFTTANAFTVRAKLTNTVTTATATSLYSVSVSAVCGFRGDPQFVGFHGQSYQVHGIPDAFFGLISEPTFSMNSRFAYLYSGSCDYNNTLCWTHPGTYVDQVGFSIIKEDGAGHHQVEVHAHSHAKGLSLIYDGQHIPIGARFTLKGVNGTFMDVERMTYDQVKVQTENFKIVLTNSDLFFNMQIALLNIELLKAGSKFTSLRHRPISMGIRGQGKQDHQPHAHAEYKMHGLIGQTWKNMEYENGRVYEGDVTDYQIGSLFEYDYVFNKYQHGHTHQHVREGNMDI